MGVSEWSNGSSTFRRVIAERPRQFGNVRALTMMSTDGKLRLREGYIWGLWKRNVGKNVNYHYGEAYGAEYLIEAVNQKVNCSVIRLENHVRRKYARRKLLKG